MASLLERQKAILDQLKAGEFLQGMKDFYAEDAVNEEVTGVRIEGKQNIIANEEQVLSQVKTFHGCTVRPYGVSDEDSAGNGVTFAEYQLKVDMKDGSTFNPKQVQVTEWRGGQAVHIRFYYDPSKL